MLVYLEQPLNDPPLIIPTSLAPSPMARVTAFLYFFTRSTTFFCVRTEDTVHFKSENTGKMYCTCNVLLTLSAPENAHEMNITATCI